MATLRLHFTNGETMCADSGRIENVQDLHTWIRAGELFSGGTWAIENSVINMRNLLYIELLKQQGDTNGTKE